MKATVKKFGKIRVEWNGKNFSFHVPENYNGKKLEAFKKRNAEKLEAMKSEVIEIIDAIVEPVKKAVEKVKNVRTNVIAKIKGRYQRVVLVKVIRDIVLPFADGIKEWEKYLFGRA